MPDDLTLAQRHKNMCNIRSTDTLIERKLRTALWHEGIRYRKNYVYLPGKPDIAITKYHIAIFCDSSFFHGKDYDSKKAVDTNHEYWDKKIRRNIDRDREVNEKLAAMGWTVVRFWDTEINKELPSCVESVKKILRAAGREDS